MTPTVDGLAQIAADPNISATNLGVFKQYVPVAPVASDCLAYSTAAASGSCAAGSVPIGAVSVANPAFQNYTNYVQSVDYNISSHDQLRGRYIYNKLDKVDQAANLFGLLHHRALPFSPLYSWANTTPSPLGDQ